MRDPRSKEQRKNGREGNEWKSAHPHAVRKIPGARDHRFRDGDDARDAPRAALRALVHPSIVLTPGVQEHGQRPEPVLGSRLLRDLEGGHAPLERRDRRALSGASAASAKTCTKSLAGHRHFELRYASDGIGVAIPMKVASNGNHTIATSFTVKLASSSSHVAPPCPKFAVTYPPALNSYEYAYCEAGADIGFSVSISVVDLGNSSWYSNYTYAEGYNDSYFENYTDCYNYGTPACYNYTANYSSAGSYSYNTAGFSAFTMNGATTFTLYSNGTKMIKTHHYVVVISVSNYVDTFAESVPPSRKVVGARDGHDQHGDARQRGEGQLGDHHVGTGPAGGIRSPTSPTPSFFCPLDRRHRHEAWGLWRSLSNPRLPKRPSVHAGQRPPSRREGQQRPFLR